MTSRIVPAVVCVVAQVMDVSAQSQISRSVVRRRWLVSGVDVCSGMASLMAASGVEWASSWRCGHTMISKGLDTHEPGVSVMTATRRPDFRT